jgi:hypothetical protein
MEAVELGANHPFDDEALELVPSGSNPRMILELRTRKGRYLAWKGKLVGIGDKLSIGVVVIYPMAIMVKL